MTTSDSQCTIGEDLKVEPRVLDSGLPIWLSEGDAYRLDNNFFHPAAYQARRKLIELADSGLGEVKLLHELFAEAPSTGVSPSEEGLLPIYEGGNIRPNSIFPVVSKYAETAKYELGEGDLLIGKDGEPGIAAVMT